MTQGIFIIDAGRFSAHLATRLSEFGGEIVLADKNAGRVEDLVQDGFHPVEMDAEDQGALKEAGADEVSIGENMQVGVLTTLLLRELQVKKLLCRAFDTRHATGLEKLGTDPVVLAPRDMACRLAERLRVNATSDRQQLCGDHQLSQTEAKNEMVAVEPAPARTNLHGKMFFLAVRRENLNRFERECGQPSAAS